VDYRIVIRGQNTLARGHIKKRKGVREDASEGGENWEREVPSGREAVLYKSLQVSTLTKKKKGGRVGQG